MTRKPYLLIREDGTAEGERVIPYPTIDLALKAFGKVTRNAPPGVTYIVRDKSVSPCVDVVKYSRNA
jgi:hypothetical protein